MEEERVGREVYAAIEIQEVAEGAAQVWDVAEGVETDVEEDKKGGVV